MSEQQSAKYRRLFEVKLLHHYWLDDGANVFDLLNDSAKKQRLLDAYRSDTLFTITPTATTQQKLIQAKALLRYTAHGFQVSIPQGQKLALDSEWLWTIRVKQNDFFSYTALTLPYQRIYETEHPQTKQKLRYKSNVAVFSNASGDSREQQLFLSQPIPTLAAEDKVESLVRVGNALKFLTGDQPGAQSKTLNAAYRKLPVYVHQGDLPLLTPPAGLQNLPRRGIELNDDIPDNLFALIKLSARRADNPQFSWLDDNGFAKATAPVFEIRFRNRATIWRYRDKLSGQITREEAAPLPLTFHGNAGSQPNKPAPAPPQSQLSGERVVRLLSDCYV